MKLRSGPPKNRAAADPRRHDSVKLVVAISLVLGTAFVACGIDDSNPPLKNEAPNRGQFVGGIAIGAGAGTGGSGAGLGAGGTSSMGGAGGALTATNCACGVTYAAGGDCLGCFNMQEGLNCTSEQLNCMGDVSTPSCATLFQSLLTCGADNATCVHEALVTGMDNSTFAALLTCGCSNCGGAMGCGAGDSCQ